MPSFKLSGWTERASTAAPIPVENSPWTKPLSRQHLRVQFPHDVSETGEADLVVCQNPAVVEHRKHGVGGGRILRVAMRFDLDDARLDPVVPLRGLRNLTGELG